MIKGFDTAARVSQTMAAALKKLGYDYAIRYLVPPGYTKALTKEEAQGLSAAGLMIGCCWETTAARARLGAAAGTADGKSALMCAGDINVPASAIIYYAVDYDAPETDFDKIEAYLRAAGAACAPYRVGVYGPYKVVEAMHARGCVSACWQCVAWSGGRVSAHNSIYQMHWNVNTGVVTVDDNYAADLDAAGLWRYEEVPMQYLDYGKMRLYNNVSRKTPRQIMVQTGCEAIINGGVFDLKTYTPGCHLKIANQVLAADEYKYWGYGIRNGVPELVQEYSTYSEYISCCCMVRNGKAETLIYNADMGGARQRSAVGTMPDGRIWLYAAKSPTTPQQLQQIALARGVKDAIMLDGGASTWMISPKGELTGGRVAANYILIYDADDLMRPLCPYQEPTGNVRLLSIGEGAKWVQWQLVQRGYNLGTGGAGKNGVDGIVGVKTVAAIKTFQRAHGLEDDGIVGKLTRAALKENEADNSDKLWSGLLTEE